ncbi:MAG: glycosyltransferase [Pseudomonadota bacterium]
MSALAMALEGLCLLVSVLLSVPVAVLLVQACSAAIARRQAARSLPAPPALRAASLTLAVVMPAHNEALGIEHAIASVLPQLQPGDRLIVVADNCSDDTAGVALAAGAEVIERFDTHLRGKGYALDFGVRHLGSPSGTPPQVVVIVDADCEVAPGALSALACASAQHQRPVQALYLMKAPVGAGLKTRMAEFAWVVKNHVRPLGFARLGLPCQLMGTGMAFPWALIRNAPLASGHIVEDMQLGLDLAAAGTPPMFWPAAGVNSRFPTQAESTTSQRTRWEHGHLSVIAAHAPRLLGQAVRRKQGVLLAMALDLCVPPLASLVLVLAAWCVLSGLLGAVTGLWAPALWAWGAFLALGSAVVLSWWGFARDIVSGAEFLSVPGYVLGKVPIYLRLLLKKGQVEWVRTERDPAAGPPGSPPPSPPPPAPK